MALAGYNGQKAPMTGEHRPPAPKRASRRAVPDRRVATLRAAVAAGSYPVDPDAIAAALIARDALKPE